MLFAELNDPLTVAGVLLALCTVGAAIGVWVANRLSRRD